MIISRGPCRDVQEEQPVAVADCGHEIYSGEYSAEWEGQMLCPECWASAVGRMLDRHPVQLAEEMGLRVERRSNHEPL